MSAWRGAPALLRAALRRDRLRCSIWIVGLGLLPVLFVSTFQRLYPDAPDRVRFVAASRGNAAFVALYGPLTGSSVGQLAAWRGGFLPVVAALVAGFLAIRHSRADEESGVTELLGALPLGGQAAERQEIGRAHV